jgi:hypothetical protein
MNAVEKRRGRKKRAGKPHTGLRPVISIRVHEPLYKQIRASADERKLTMSEEAERLLALAVGWEGAERRVRKILAGHEHILARGKEVGLRFLAGLIGHELRNVARYEEYRAELLTQIEGRKDFTQWLTKYELKHGQLPDDETLLAAYRKDFATGLAPKEEKP